MQSFWARRLENGNIEFVFVFIFAFILFVTSWQRFSSIDPYIFFGANDIILATPYSGNKCFKVEKGEFQMQSFWARRLETGNIAPDSIGNSSPLYFSAFLH